MATDLERLERIYEGKIERLQRENAELLKRIESIGVWDDCKALETKLAAAEAVLLGVSPCGHKQQYLANFGNENEPDHCVLCVSMESLSALARKDVALRMARSTLQMMPNYWGRMKALEQIDAAIDAAKTGVE